MDFVLNPILWLYFSLISGPRASFRDKRPKSGLGSRTGPGSGSLSVPTSDLWPLSKRTQPLIINAADGTTGTRFMHCAVTKKGC